MAILITPLRVIRKNLQWGVRKWHFEMRDSNGNGSGVIVTTCSILLQDYEIAEVSSVLAENICKKCLGAMKAE
jgi:hypothetical protein